MKIKIQKIIYLLLFIILLFWDLYSKYYFFVKKTSDPAKILQIKTFIEPICNHWISFSISISWWIIFIITLLSIWATIYFYYKNKIPWIIFALLMAGIIWNFYDRLYIWCVRDFINFFNLFIFNLADLYLNIWVIILIYLNVFKKNN